MVPECLVIRPNRQEFSKPFTSFVEDVLARHPGVPCFKVVPPKGWSARSTDLSNLEDVQIGTPIKQHVFGTKGAYRCVLEEQQNMSVGQFKRLAYDADHQPPKQGHREDSLLERAFWSAVTLSPPLYGADTPQSFFDAKLEWGWNLRKLQCLLSKRQVPKIPGVNTPMTYFGMWKSFFSWHVEDVDLYSINYLHYGAPKVWYCVRPEDQGKFEGMCKALFPELARNCKAFMRHKDVLLSPRVLRSFNIEVVTVKQEVGEFMVLAAGAFHSGYNQGYNCAEAINFALHDWIPRGRRATRCTCTALDDAVRLDVRLFKQEGEVWTSDEEDAAWEGYEPEDSGSEISSQTKAEQSSARRRASGRGSSGGLVTRSAGPTAGRKRRQPELASPPASKGGATPRLTVNGKRRGRPPKSESLPAVERPKSAPAQQKALSPKAARRSTGGAQQRGRGRPRGRPPGKRLSFRRAASQGTTGTAEEDSEAVDDSPADSEAEGAHFSSRAAKAIKRVASPAGAKWDLNGAATPAGASEDELLGDSDEQGALGEATSASEGDGAGEEGSKPKVIVGEDDTGKRFFYLVKVEERAAKAGSVMLRWLEEGSDGLYRPSNGLYSEDEQALIDVRTQWMKGRGRRPGGYKLLTMRSRILNIELVD